MTAVVISRSLRLIEILLTVVSKFFFDSNLNRRVKVAILNARFEDCNIFECRTSDLEHLTIMQTALLLGLAILDKTNKQLPLFEQQLLSF